jgi:ubiquinone/menaquinone biosynthesis C-methylase UbiE
MMTGLPSSLEILDVACGPGMQTMELARISKGRITAVDTHQPFLDELQRRTKDADFGDRIQTSNASMFAMPFAEHRFNIIWCEGAMYMMGINEALTNWRRFLASGGYIAFTEPCFLTDNLPEPVKRHWVKDYPAMTNIEGTLRLIDEVGFRLIGHFTLPNSAWWQDYYTPQEERLKMLREKYSDNPAALAGIEQTQQEIDTHRVFAQYYGYEFFVVKAEKQLLY